jgi:predicted nucleotidyltransferase
MSVSPADLAYTLLRRAAAQREADDQARANALDAVTNTLHALRSRLHFGRVWLIGSLAWGGFGLRSDIDVVVEGTTERVLFAIAEEVGRSSGRLVDGLALETLPESFAARVLAEGQLVT